MREAGKEDAEKIYNNLKLCAENMYNKLGLEHWIPVYSKESIEKDIEAKKVFIVEQNNKVVGNFILTEEKNSLWKENKNAIYLSKLAIIPEFSGNGLGKKCMKYIEEYAKRKNYEYVRFDVYEKSENTIAFYKKIGYETVGTAKTRRFTVLLMEKRI